MVVGWPGIGNIGVITVDALRQHVQAEDLGEIEPWDFFYPTRAKIKSGVLDDMEFPGSRFYFKQLPDRDVILFIGDEQPSSQGRVYAEGGKAYEMANLVLDVAERFGCRRIYTCGAAVGLTHHSLPPRVWAVATSRELIAEARGFPNTVLMSEVEGQGELGNITGLNGLVVGVARQRGFEGVCLMGEIPDYLSRVPFPYPKAAQAVLDVFGSALGVEIEPGALDEMSGQMEMVISNVYRQFPQEVREKIERRKESMRTQPGSITEDDQKWLKEHIDDFFRGQDRGQ